MLLRSILSRLEAKQGPNVKSRQQIKLELMQNALRKWRKAAFAKQMLMKKMIAINHYKCQMLFKYFYHLRRAPCKTRACVMLVRLLYRTGLGKPFAQIKRVYKER